MNLELLEKGTSVRDMLEEYTLIRVCCSLPLRMCSAVAFSVQSWNIDRCSPSDSVSLLVPWSERGRDGLSLGVLLAKSRPHVVLRFVFALDGQRLAHACAS